MRALLLCVLLVPLAAHADLYRWIDPETGSVKFSSYPPPWLGDPDRERAAHAVEVVPFQPIGAPKPPENLNTFAVATLEARRRELAQQLAKVPERGSIDRGGAALRQQLEAYQALVAELDRLDPANAPRRRNENQSLMQTLQKLFETK